MIYTFIKRSLARCTAAIFCITGLPLLYILEPFVRIRIGLMYNRRIGHMALNTDLFLKYSKVHPPKPRTYYFFALYNPCNRQLAEMIKRHITVIESRWFTWFVIAVRGVLMKTGFFERMPLHSEEYRHELINLGPSDITFTPEEETRGKACLNEMGIGDDDWFVCFASRDLLYLNTWSPADRELFKRTTHRNCSIETFRAAAEDIAAQGGFAIRMGYMVSEPFPPNGNPHIIDYATDFRTDFGDIYVGAKCRAFVSANSGIMMPPSIMGVRIGMVNTIPFFARPMRDTDLFTPKLLRDAKTGEFVTFADCDKYGFFDPACNPTFLKSCAEHGLEILDNDDDDILGITRDVLQTPEDDVQTDVRELQLMFRDRFQNYDGRIGHGGLIAPSFAKRFEQLITA